MEKISFKFEVGYFFYFYFFLFLSLSTPPLAFFSALCITGPSLIASQTRGSKGDGHSTVFEERGSVTAVCWNGNPEFGGWAAAGSAGGLVRIEDLAYD